MEDFIQQWMESFCIGKLLRTTGKLFIIVEEQYDQSQWTVSGGEMVYE